MKGLSFKWWNRSNTCIESKENDEVEIPGERSCCGDHLRGRAWKRTRRRSNRLSALQNLDLLVDRMRSLHLEEAKEEERRWREGTWREREMGIGESWSRRRLPFRTSWKAPPRSFLLLASSSRPLPAPFYMRQKLHSWLLRSTCDDAVLSFRLIEVEIIATVDTVGHREITDVTIVFETTVISGCCPHRCT